MKKEYCQAWAGHDWNWQQWWRAYVGGLSGPEEQDELTVWPGREEVPCHLAAFTAVLRRRRRSQSGDWELRGHGRAWHHFY